MFSEWKGSNYMMPLSLSDNLSVLFTDDKKIVTWIMAKKRWLFQELPNNLSYCAMEDHYTVK